MKIKIFLAFWFMSGLFISSQSLALTCSEVRQLVLLYLRLHYSYDTYDDELSQRTLDNFVKAWDPGKLYFYKADIDEFNKKFGKSFDDQLNKIDCGGVDFIVNRYSKRFEERQGYIDKLIDSKFDFKKDEYMLIDRKKIKFATTLEEVNERWRKRIKFQFLNLKSSLSEKKVRDKLKKRYILARKRHNELTHDKVFGAFLNAFSSSLDPHSTYFAPDDLEDFRIRTRLSLEGIGASLRSEEGFTVVASLVKGGAAEKNGQLKVNDKITAVAQDKGSPVDVIDMDLQEVVKLIRGAQGTTVRLSVLREDKDQNKKMIIPIIREKIQLVDQQASSKLVDVDVTVKGKKEKMKIGVITLPSFYIDFEGRHQKLKNYRSSSNDTKREIEDLRKKGVQGILIDLRSNGGGSLEESIILAGLFFDSGPVVQVKNGSGETEALNDRDGKTFYDGPVGVMISRHSASASEIFAGAIKDYERGIVLGGDHTFGKGTVQNLNDVAPTLGAIKVTINQFYRPSGATTQLRGVASDIRLPSLLDELEVGEKTYDYALPFETIKAAPHKKFGMVAKYIKNLKQRSVARVASDTQFADVFKEIEEYKKNKDERSKISLKEKKEADKDEAEKSKNDDVLGDATDLVNDIYMQESVRVMADYVRSLRGQTLGNLVLPEVVEASKKKKALAKKKAVKKEVKPKKK